MALALLFEDDSVIILDAVTQYSKTRNSSISKHPIDKSAVIADHVAKDNPVFSIRGIISSADFHNPSTRSPELIEEQNVDPVYNTPVSDAVIPSQSSLLDLLPGSVQQFLNAQESNIEVDEFRGYSHEIARERLQDAWDNSELITILDYDYDSQIGRSVSTKQIENCLIRNFEDIEDVDTGDSLSCNLTFEKVRFAFVKEVDVDVQPAPSVSDAAAGESNEGDQESGGDGDLDREGQQPYWKTAPPQELIDAILGGGL